MVGSHTAGAETYLPLIDTAVGNLLDRHCQGVQPASFNQQQPPQPPAAMRICFVGVENKSAEEIGDFKDQIYQQIDTRIVQSQVYCARSVAGSSTRASARRGCGPTNCSSPRTCRRFADAM